MAERRPYSSEENSVLLAMRRSGATWPAIAAALGRGRSSVIEQGRALGIKALEIVFRPVLDPLEWHRDRITLMHHDGALPAEIADKIDSIDPKAAATVFTVQAAMTRWRLERKPMPPGYSITWGALTAGTSLQGSAYA